MAHGEITHLELPTDEPARAKAFYEGLFGWKIEAPAEHPTYQIFHSGPGDMGGTIGLRGETAPNQPRIYITVDSVDEALTRVDGLGGSVAVGKTEVPGRGWYAAIVDSEGSEIGIWEALSA